MKRKAAAWDDSSATATRQESSKSSPRNETLIFRSRWICGKPPELQSGLSQPDRLWLFERTSLTGGDYQGLSPRIMHRIVNRSLLIGFERRTELDLLSIHLPEGNRALFDFPIYPAIEVLHYRDLNRFRFVVAQRDLEGFIHRWRS